MLHRLAAHLQRVREVAQIAHRPARACRALPAAAAPARCSRSSVLRRQHDQIGRTIRGSPARRVRAAPRTPRRSRARSSRRRRTRTMPAMRGYSRSAPSSSAPAAATRAAPAAPRTACCSKSMCGLSACAVQRRHELPVLHLQQHLGQPGDAGRRSRRWPMFDFAEPIAQNCVSCGVRAGTPCVSAGDLDRIAELRAGAVRLDVADRAADRRPPSAAPARSRCACACGFGTV